MVTQAIAEVMNVGDHGSTFAGNPLVCHAAEAVVDIITAEGFLEDVTRKGEKLRAGLEQALGSNPHVKQVRGLGLIVGVQLDVVRLLAACCTHLVQKSTLHIMLVQVKFNSGLWQSRSEPADCIMQLVQINVAA